MGLLKVQPWEEWSPRGLGPMQVVGELDASVYERLRDEGWEWDLDEEDYEEIPEPVMVLLLARDGQSRFMLEAAPSAGQLGIRVLGPGDEERAQLAAELCDELAIPEGAMRPTSSWPAL